MKLIYITSDPTRARAVEAAGVDQVMIDLEINGKVERQGHLDTVISRHHPDDISMLRGTLSRSELMVRVNPLFDGSAAEIEDVIGRGADRLMLPMFTTAGDVEQFCRLVGGRTRITLLVETPAALARLPDILEVSGVDAVHIGLNDLHLGFGLDFMFELLAGGIVEHAARLTHKRGLKFGFGGVARLGEGRLPAALVLSEHVRLGSTQVILSRDFGRVFDDAGTTEEAAQRFAGEVGRLRAHVEALSRATPEELEKNRLLLRDSVRSIAAERRS